MEVCLVKEVVDERDDGSKTVSMIAMGNTFHSVDDRPSFRQWNRDGKLVRQTWHLFGMLHRPFVDRDPETGRWLPARIYVDIEEDTEAHEWYCFGAPLNLDTDEEGMMLPWRTVIDRKTGKVKEFCFKWKQVSLKESDGQYYVSDGYSIATLCTRKKFDQHLREMTDRFLEWKAEWIPNTTTKSASKV